MNIENVQQQFILKKCIKNISGKTISVKITVPANGSIEITYNNIGDQIKTMLHKKTEWPIIGHSVFLCNIVFIMYKVVVMYKV